MNLDKLFSWIVGIVIAYAAVGQLDTLQNWVMRVQAKVIYESRSSNWGSPRFFAVPEHHSQKNQVEPFAGSKKRFTFAMTSMKKILR